MIGIIAAMNTELSGIRAEIENAREETVSSIKFITGTIYGKDVVCAVCGIGKINAAVCAQTMILKYSPDCIINTGVGGALDRELHTCDVVCASYAVQHDVDTTALGDEIGLVSTVNVVRFPVDEKVAEGLVNAMKEAGVTAVRGGIATGDQFVCTKEVKERIVSLFGCKVCEMEGGSIAHVCYLNHVPCGILRAISDGADEGATMSFTEFADKAAQNSVKVLLSYIKNA